MNLSQLVVDHQQHHTTPITLFFNQLKQTQRDAVLPNHDTENNSSP
jgi:hypothetical protein